MIVIETGKYTLGILLEKDFLDTFAPKGIGFQPSIEMPKMPSSTKISDLTNSVVRELFNFVYLSGLTDMIEFFHCWLRVEHKIDIKEEDRSKYVLIKLS